MLIIFTKVSSETITTRARDKTVLVRQPRVKGNIPGLIIMGTLLLWVGRRVYESIAISVLCSFFPLRWSVKSLIILEAR